MDYGPCYINIPGGELHGYEEGRFISIPVDSSITLVEAAGVRRRELAITGSKQTLVIRVKLNGVQPTPSATVLAGSAFGLGGKPAAQTLVGQYNACSFGQLQFFPAEGTNILNGVMDIDIKKGNGTLSTLTLLSDLAAAATAKMPAGMNPNHIMYVLPYGTAFQGNKNWVAFAYVGGRSSYFNNMWGDSLSATMHEIGHNLGFRHSGEGDNDYGDQTNLMGYR
jgi:hypothetical protein